MPGKSFIFRILDVKRHADLSIELKQEWTSEWCSQGDFVYAQWCSVVGDDDGVITRSVVGLVPGELADSSELALRRDSLRRFITFARDYFSPTFLRCYF